MTNRDELLQLKKSDNQNDDQMSDKSKDNSGLYDFVSEMSTEILTWQYFALGFWYCMVSLRINCFQAWFNASLAELEKQKFIELYRNQESFKTITKY